MNCSECKASDRYFDGDEVIGYCKLGVCEENAYHDGYWYCNKTKEQIDKKLLLLEARLKKKIEVMQNEFKNL